MADFKEHTWHRFWLKSGRGTNLSNYVLLSPHADPGYSLEEWAHEQGGDDVTIEYGREKVDMPPQNVLQGKIKRVARRLRVEMDVLKAYERMLAETYGAPDPHEI